jgi:DNA-binding transcriptional MerR regulator
VSARAVRYSERLGLLPAAPRSPAGHRRYDQGAVERLRLVKGAQRAGLRLREIAGLRQVLDRGQRPCGHTETLLRERLAEVDAELARLGVPGPEQACTVETADGWWCVQAFAGEGGDGDGGVPQLRCPCGEPPCPCCGAP